MIHLAISKYNYERICRVIGLEWRHHCNSERPGSSNDLIQRAISNYSHVPRVICHAFGREGRHLCDSNRPGVSSCGTKDHQPKIDSEGNFEVQL